MNLPMLDFYRQQSEITEPGQAGRYLDDLPHDVAGLVQVVRYLQMELLGCDAWHPLIDKKEAAVTPTEYTLLDQIASLTTQVDEHHPELRQLYNQSEYGW